MRLDRVVAIARKEWAEHMAGGVAPLALAALQLLLGWVHTSSLFVNNRSDLSELFDVLPFVFSIFMPALTMRAFAEEFRLDTMSLLATQPVSEAEIVFGKFLGAFGWAILALLLMQVHVVQLLLLGRPDVGALAAGFIGAALLAGAFVALGLWASSLSRSQPVALLIGFLLCFVPLGLARAANHAPGGLGGALAAIGAESRFASCARGVLDSRDVLYFATLTAAGLLLARSTLSRRLGR